LYLYFPDAPRILVWLQKSDPIFKIGVDVVRPVLIFKPNIGLLCLLEMNGPEELRLFPQLKGSSDLQMGPGLRR